MVAIIKKIDTIRPTSAEPMTNPMPLSAPSSKIRIVFCPSIEMLYLTTLKPEKH